MDLSALLIMLFIQGSITAITAYLFYRVINGRKKKKNISSSSQKKNV